MQGLDPEWLGVNSLKWFESISNEDHLYLNSIVARTMQKYNETEEEPLVIPIGLLLTFISYGAILSQLIDSKMTLIKPTLPEEKQALPSAYNDPTWDLDTEGI